jgi:hypothetical protein
MQPPKKEKALHGDRDKYRKPDLPRKDRRRELGWDILEAIREKKRAQGGW